MSGLVGRGAEAQDEHELAPARAEINLAGQQDVPLLGPAVGAGQPPVASQVGPAVGDAHEPRRAGRPRGRAGQGHGGPAPLGEEHRAALVPADPAGAPDAPPQPHVRVQQGVEPVILQGPA